MDKDIANMKSHDVHDLVPRVRGLRTLKLGWACARRSKTEFLTRTRPSRPPGINIAPRVDYGESIPPVMCLESLCTLLVIMTSPLEAPGWMDSLG